LTITNANRSDSGEYTCLATNILGTLLLTGIVNVQYQPEITTHPQSQSTTEGENETLSCNASGNPEPTFSWTRNNGSGVVFDAHISFSWDKKRLIMTNVRRSDSGQYRCLAHNSLGNATSNAATLDVQYQPEFTAHHQNKTITEGDLNVTFSCDAIGNPVPIFIWAKDGSAVNTSVNPRASFSSDKKQLTINSPSRVDGGEYRCVAANSVGTILSNAIALVVKCKYNFFPCNEG